MAVQTEFLCLICYKHINKLLCRFFNFVVIEQGFFCRFSQEHPQKRSIRTFKTQIRSSGQSLFTDLVQDS